MFKILHIARDDKFIDIGFKNFEIAQPNSNSCIIITDTEIKFVKKTPYQLFRFKDIQSEKFADYLKQFDAIVLHSLFSIALPIPSSCKVLWIGWGYDYYDIISKSPLDFMLKKTRRAYRQLCFKTYLKGLVSRYSWSLVSNKQKKKLAFINKLDYFAPVLNAEYPLVKTNIKEFSPKFVDWNYNAVIDMLTSLPDKKVNSNNILIGNSASFENNHIEAFELLKRLQLSDRQYIVPLSYGIKRYKKRLLKKGQALFSNKFTAVTDFMGLEQYIEMLLQCGFAIMNHTRQQGLGNINIMLWLGAKVFVRQINPIYASYQSLGMHIYLVEELEQDPSLLNETLSDSQVKDNRALLLSLFSNETIVDKTKNVIAALKNG